MKKELKDYLESELTVILLTVFNIFVYFFVAGGICFLVKNISSCPSSESSNNPFLCLISGLIGSVISAVVVLVSLKSNNNTSKAEAHLKLRELFATEPRMKINEYLLLYNNLCTMENEDELSLVEKLKFGKREDIKPKNNKELKEKIETELKNDIANLYDYLGIFEVASEMLKNKILDKKLFKESYGYRLRSIKTAFENMDFLKKQKSSGDWDTLLGMI